MLDHILLIDDDVRSIFIIKRLLEKLKITKEISVAKNGKDGLEKIFEYNEKNKCPDLIFLDSHMPVMDGHEFLVNFHKMKLQHNPVVVLLTNSLNDKNIEGFYQLGITEFIAKPLKEDAAMKIYEKYYYQNH